MDRKIRRLAQLYSKAACDGDQRKAKICVRLMQRFGIYEDVKYKLEKYQLASAIF